MSGKQFLVFLLFHEIINFVGLKYVYSRYFQRNNYIIKIERIPYGFIGRFKAIRIEKFKLVLKSRTDCRSLQHRQGIRSMFVSIVRQSPNDVAIELRGGTIDQFKRALGPAI